MNRDVAEERRLSSHGNRNPRQDPSRPGTLPHEESNHVPSGSRSDRDSYNPCHEGSIKPIKAVVKHTCNVRLPMRHVCPVSTASLPSAIPPNPIGTGYEALRIRYDFDMLDLSCLTPVHVCGYHHPAAPGDAVPAAGYPSEQAVVLFLLHPMALWEYETSG